MTREIQYISDDDPNIDQDRPHIQWTSAEEDYVLRMYPDGLLVQIGASSIFIRRRRLLMLELQCCKNITEPMCEDKTHDHG